MHGRHSAGAIIAIALVTVLLLLANATTPALARSNYVIQISVDGLGSAYLQPLLQQNAVPNIARLMREGASTLNARTDTDYTLTLPNHTSMLSGRPVQDKYGSSISGHGWITNTTPPPTMTLHINRGFYIASTFDVAHDNGLSTALYASKDKFALFDNSWNAVNGAIDTTGADNGRDKIDTFVNVDLNATAMFTAFKANMQANPTRYTFVHFDSPDSAGHAYGWGSTQYTTAVVLVDGLIGQMLALIDNSPQLKNNTYIMLTADHGGTGKSHSDNTLAINYTVPFLVWGSGIQAGDLYTLNGAATADPGVNRIDYSLTAPQPIRSGDAGNCALHLLGLPAIPGSSLDHLQSVCKLGATPMPTATPFKTYLSILMR